MVVLISACAPPPLTLVVGTLPAPTAELSCLSVEGSCCISFDSCSQKCRAAARVDGEYTNATPARETCAKHKGGA